MTRARIAVLRNLARMWHQRGVGTPLGADADAFTAASALHEALDAVEALARDVEEMQGELQEMAIRREEG